MIRSFIFWESAYDYIDQYCKIILQKNTFKEVCFAV